MRWIWGFIFVLLPICAACGESYSTPNFIAHGPDAMIAEKVARTAEYFRKHLAFEWTGNELPKWSRRCPIQVSVGSMGASGSTTFTFEGGEVHSWDMRVRGSLERILDSVVPHEVCHTIFASKFRRPLPRWADEGAATLVEHHTERLRQVDHLNRAFGNHRQIPLKQLFEIREYPGNPEELYTLYAEGYSLAEFLVQKSDVDQQSDRAGKRVYLDFLGDALSRGWDDALREHYGYRSTRDLEQEWSRWVLAGSPSRPNGVELVASRTRSVQRDSARGSVSGSLESGGDAASSKNRGGESASMIYRSQTPSEIAPLALIARPLRRETVSALDAPAPAVNGVQKSAQALPLRLRLPGTRR